MSGKPLDEKLMAASESLYALACDVGKLQAENEALKEDIYKMAINAGKLKAEIKDSKNILNKIHAVLESVDTSTDSCDRLHHNISMILHENTN